MQIQPAQIAPSPISSSAAEPVLVRIPPDHLQMVAEVVLPMLEGVVERSAGRWTMIALLRQIYEGNWALWVVWDGSDIRMIVGTEIYEELSGKKFCGIRFATGGGAKQLAPLISTIEDYARENGCHAVDGWARKGWAKYLPDYKLTHVLLEKDLA